MSDYKGTGSTGWGELQQAYKGCNKLVFRNPHTIPWYVSLSDMRQIRWALSSTKRQNSVFWDVRRGNAAGRVLGFYLKEYAAAER